MHLSVERDQHGTVTVRQTAVPVLRVIIGVPLLVGGAVMAYGVVSSVVLQVQADGLAGLPVALAGAFLLLIFAAMLLPLGWWLVASRHWIVLEAGPGDVVEVSDWRFGRQERRTAASAFRAVRVALEPVRSTPGGRASSAARAYCQQIRLLARDPDSQPSIEIGALERDERDEAIVAAQRVAEVLRLPVEIGERDVIVSSPAQEAAEAEAQAEAEADALEDAER